jgi:hypothetical protein
MAIVSVYAIVKVMRLNKTVYDNGIWASQEFENLKKDLDNRIENIRIVCPNCEATLSTHCGKNVKKRKKIKKLSPDDKFISIMNHSIKNRKTERPPYELLQKQIKYIGYVATGERYGVSDNAVRKWIKFYEKYGH